MNPLIKELLKHSKYNKLLKDVQSKEKKLSIIGLNTLASAHIIYSLYNYTNQIPFVVCTNISSAKSFIQDLKFYTDQEVVFIPPREILYYNIDTKSRDELNERALAINKLIKNEECIFVTTIDSILTPVLPKDSYKGSSFVVEKNKNINIEEFLSKLKSIGYTRVDVVEAKGQAAVRGGIIDVYPVSEELPVRIELFGNEIESLRRFDLLTQRSIENVDSLEISFAEEEQISKSAISNCILILENILTQKNISIKLKENISKDLEKLKENKIDGLLDKYFDLLVPEKSTLMDYLGDNYTVYINEVSSCKLRSKNILFENHENLKHMTEKELVYPKYSYRYLSFEELEIALGNLSSVYVEKMNRR